MKAFELICVAYLKNDIGFRNSFEIIAKYINYSIHLAGLDEIHESKDYKFYTFGSFYPTEQDKIYKKSKIYKFTIRTLNKTLANALNSSLKDNTNNKHFTIVEISSREVSQFFISELYSVSPVIVSVDNGRFWTIKESGNVEQLKELLHNNAKKKYKNFFNKEIDIQQNFIQLIEIKNKVPQNIIITKNDKEVQFFGNKLRIIPNEDDISQKLAFIAFSCGIGEKNSYGGGFVLAKGIK
ncbi:MAG: CRISPR-associated endoribonuclease Cas6 [Campylobacteraceae bacterium]|jgi:CRISPR-associated endoribonuclease Cas6|nr:CRISPR-associated endoribonuclease Cas6 [Campylobacteraceae bacterium]